MDVQKSFSKVAHGYAKVAKVQEEIGERLMSRMAYFKVNPQCILDLGAGPGYFSLQLKKRFPKALVISIDISHAMLRQMKKTWRMRPHKVVADMVKLPCLTNKVDLVFANQSLHWSPSFEKTIQEISRVLKKEGLLLFSSLGPDTFNEIQNAWQGIDNHAHVNHFYDMHDIGDILLKRGFIDPVVDMEYLTARYQTVFSLAKDLKLQGVKNIHTNRARGLITPKQWTQFELAYEKFRDKDNLLPLSYEVIYGQAWAREIKAHANEVCVPIETLRRRP